MGNTSEFINDQYIIEYFNNFKKTHKRIDEKYFEEDIKEYLKNKYRDSLSLKESLYRILNNIEIRPTCKHCNNFVNFINLNKGFCNYCSNKCAQNDQYILNKIKQTKLERYGDKNYVNIEKIKQTCLKKYGVEHILQNNNFKQKVKQTKLERYGNENYVNTEKIKQTCLKKYNSEYYLNSKDCKEKFIKKYGVDNYRKTDKCKNEISEYHKIHKNELNEKRKLTYIKHFGVNNPMKSDLIKNKFDWKEQKRKEYITKRKNNSFNISNLEEESYILLKEKYSDIKRQYKSNVYPFLCDFYIPSLDLYIECNYHWTHGYKIFEGSKEDLILLNEWKEHNTKYYDEAIKTWTVRDINKLNIAKENNLNYILFYNINELKNWIKNGI